MCKSELLFWDLFEPGGKSFALIRRKGPWEYLKRCNKISACIVKRTAYDSPILRKKKSDCLEILERASMTQIRKEQLLRKSWLPPLAAQVFWACFPKSPDLGCFRSIESPAIRSNLLGLSNVTIQGFSDCLSCFIFRGIGKGNFLKEEAVSLLSKKNFISTC